MSAACGEIKILARLAYELHKNIFMVVTLEMDNNNNHNLSVCMEKVTHFV